MQVAVAQRLPVLLTTDPGEGKVAPKAEKFCPASGVTPAAVTFGSAGIGSNDNAPQVTAAHGSATVIVRSNDVT